ncbi:hypothetical protein C8A00DRAFT_36896 [Chaetomidium leptoderma]|uniref:C3H1-type domain-containing protein n=1 Tax=Chaetomidium leptoderma TaxID=669021 RepID=A0AAN6VFF1_9PEZI|nr:hypothetical protein C8A00DRAFT_36896 [Chaetomidium leptoderma]
MTVCRFFQQGNCRYGNNCKFEHPPKGGQQQNYNRYAAFSGQGQSNQGMAPDAPPYPGLTEEIIHRDLALELPQWILSCYGPGRDAPEQLWGGYPREQSTEEIRLHFMLGAMAGNPQGALADIQALHQNAQQQIQHTLSSIPAAIQFIVDAGKSHPNRIDICLDVAGGAAAGAAFGNTANAFQNTVATANPFGAPAAPASTGAFGQPAAMGQKPNPFGAPALAQPAAQPAPSAFGQPAASAFGQPAALGGSTAFGRPAQPMGAFGQTSTLGAKPNPFGAAALAQPVQPAGPAFGQSGFGQPATLGAKPNPFGAPAAGGGPFATTTQPAPANNPFGQPAQPAQQAQTAPNNQPANNPFGQPAPSNPFGQPANAPANPFGQPPQQQQPTTNPFGAPAALTAPAAPANPFGQPATTSAFGAPAATTAAPPANPFGQQPSTSASAATTAAAPGQGHHSTNPTGQHPDVSTYSSHNPDKSLRMFKGKPVFYEEPKGGGKPVPLIRNFDGSTIRVWNPDGPPANSTDTECEPAKYADPNIMRQWKAFADTGRFAGGVMPEVPPKKEFCMFDF